MEDKRAHLESLRVPTIHLNGTHPLELTRNLEAAYQALTEACRALNETQPHGRDYTGQGPDGYTEAFKQHKARGAKLCEVMDELAFLAHEIHERNEVPSNG